MQEEDRAASSQSDNLRARMRAAFAKQTGGDGEPTPEVVSTPGRRAETAGPFVAPPRPVDPPTPRPAQPSPRAAARATVRRAKPPENDDPLTGEEHDTLVVALMEFSEMFDQGLWHLGWDTDPTMPAADGTGTGVPLFAMERDEAEKVARAFLKRGEQHAQIFVAARAVIAAYNDVEAGIILGSRFFAVVMMFFQEGVNFRLSRRDYMAKRTAAQQ